VLQILLPLKLPLYSTRFELVNLGSNGKHATTTPPRLTMQDVSHILQLKNLLAEIHILHISLLGNRICKYKMYCSKYLSHLCLVKIMSGTTGDICYTQLQRSVVIFKVKSLVSLKIKKKNMIK
jgi:hypothetical protein